MPPIKLFVGYKTRVADGIENDMPEFRAPANWKDPKKIEDEIASRRAEFLATAKDMPYTGVLEEVCLLDPSAERDGGGWGKCVSFRERAGEEAKPPVAVRVRNYLLKQYPKAWTNDTHDRVPPKVAVFGFDPRTFLKMLGLACAMPGVAKPCPVSLWYNNTDHRDIIEAVMPKDFKGLDLAYVLKRRRPVEPGEAQKWDELLAGWAGPGDNPRVDATLAVWLADQLGFLEE